MELSDECRIFLLIKNGINLNQLRDLMRRGEDPNRRFGNGSTTLIEVINSFYETDCIVRELINAGADVNMRDYNGQTALHFAVMQRDRFAFEELVKSGASINAKDRDGETILHLAVTTMQRAMRPRAGVFDPWFADELLKHEDIDVNAVDSKGNTPLMIAVMHGRSQEVLKLLRNKANPNISNNRSKTPLHYELAYPINPSTSYFLHYGADIYSKDNEGQTPIDIFIQATEAYGFDPSTILKQIIFKYIVTDELKQKFKRFTNLSDFINKCFDEVDQMKKDFICGNYTLYDFLSGSLNASEFENVLLHVHVPVIQKLVKFDYSEYLCDSLRRIPESNMYRILQIMAFEKKT